ncbi:hypothetical protein EBO15_37070 [Actinomadura harenae]|uniref:Uncharacterized protein n=2 Tax=Actinomadura harenae TaxID=2483351 RepID=A0A3M2LLP8_9ACTN|nr:hypothetical protein EBO15_37070 [Actinomadura harenae]
MAARVNRAWFRLATEYGLFNEDREFLIGVDYAQSVHEPDWGWLQVQLLDEWDIVGSEVGLLGGPGFDDRYIPEFTAVSLDRAMILHVTLWGNGTISSIVIRPDTFDAI